jgi:hypothetical protein
MSRTASIALCLLAGCAAAPPAEDYDPQLAREALVTALDAWRVGTPADLAKRTPPIHFVDDDWRRGLKLESYELADTIRAQPFKDLPVVLRLRDAKGRVVPRAATYQVSLKPRVAVIRTDT